MSTHEQKLLEVLRFMAPKIFRVGQKVRMSDSAIKQGFQGRAKSTTGVVTATNPTRLRVKVRRDGIKTANWYHVRFWQGTQG